MEGTMRILLINKKYCTSLFTILVLFVSLFFLNGCAEMGMGGSSGEELDASVDASEAAAENQPYYPTDFKDLLIPSELTWNRENSIAIKTDSFAGGILHFTGRVELNSLSDFFVNTMAKNNWKMSGSVKYKKIVLAFIKPNKTCTIIISENEFGMKTSVYVYITEDLTASMPMNPAIVDDSF